MYFLLALSLLAVRVVGQCQQLQLDWAHYDGQLVDGICQYENVRFAAPPLGSLRFNAPQPPQASNPPAPAGVTCVQMDRSACLPQLGESAPQGNSTSCFAPVTMVGQEDCLFLDIYVPVTAFSSSKALPVIVWFYGGAYLFGAKIQSNLSQVPLYDGEGVATRVVSENTIFVAGNYRLGAFGWLAGDYMETTQGLMPNAGLLDQRMMLKFVNTNIQKLNGDPSRVSLWGESAGASSIMHHLTMPENIQTPLFNSAILQSPAYQWLWDRKGALNRTFTAFAQAVQTLEGCSAADVQCIQGASSSNLQQANQDLFQTLACEGIMPVGPSVDGVNVPELASHRVQLGQIAPLDSIIVSHVHTEIPYPQDLSQSSFIPLPIREDPDNATTFDVFLGEYASGPAYAPIRASINQTYASGNFDDQVARAQQVIMDSSFLCHTRFLIDAYKSAGTKTFAMDYAFLADRGAAVHASDLPPTFWHSGIDYTALIECLHNQIPGFIVKKINSVLTTELAPEMQTYFVNLAANNDPGTVEYQWYPVDYASCPDGGGSCVTNLMQPSFAFIEDPWSTNDYTDPQTSSDVCTYWADIATNITQIAEGQGRLQHEQQQVDLAAGGDAQQRLRLEL